MKQCSKCKQLLPEELNFCIHCGGKAIEMESAAKTNSLCAGCGNENPPALNFCIHCGSKMQDVQVSKDQPPKGVFTCSHCGTATTANLNYCRSCGTALHRDNKKEADIIPEKPTTTMIHSTQIKVSSTPISNHTGYSNQIQNPPISNHAGDTNQIQNPSIANHAGDTNQMQNPSIANHAGDANQKQKTPGSNHTVTTNYSKNLPIANPVVKPKHKKKTSGIKWIAIGISALLVFTILIVKFIQDRPYILSGNVSGSNTPTEGVALEITSLQFHPDKSPEENRSISGEWLEQRDVSLNQECRIVFNSPLKASNENKKSISVTQWDGTPVDTEIQIEKNSLVVKPSTSYKPGHFYLLNITQDLQSSKGNLLEEPLSLSFVTQADILSTSLVSKTLQPSNKKQEVNTEEGLKVVIPGGILEREQLVEVNEITGTYETMEPIESEQLKVYEIKIGERKTFSEPIFIEIPIEPSMLSVSIPVEYALKARYWDEALYRWVDSPAYVDLQNKKLIIPTLHLTKWSVLATKADGHIYNEYFSMYYSSAQMKQIEKTSVTNFVAQDYIYGVFDAFNEAREKYEQAGFRELEKIQAIQEVYLQEYPKAIPVPYFNIYLTGDVLNNNATRSKYTGSITIPIDNYTGVNHFQIAHELFHSVQNRYYYAIGMTEFGVPLTTAPSNQFLSRQWWLEGSADYAAGRVAYPDSNKPNPNMGGILDAKHLEKPLTHSPTALALWAPDDKHSYNNAWLFEFLVQEKNVNFKELFETVASYYNPSVYSNLVRYFKEKKMDFNEIFSEYAVWWFSHPNSPLGDAYREKGMDKVIAMEYPAAYEHQFIFPGWHTDNLHMVKAMKLAGKDNDSETRYIILSASDYEGWSDSNALTTFVLPEDKKQKITPKKMTADAGYLVQKLSVKDALYILAINNVGYIWTPEVKINEVELTYEYVPLEGSHQFIAQGSKIPDFLEEGLTVIWEVDGKSAVVDDKPDIQVEGDKIKLESTFNIKEIEEHRIDVKIVSGKQEILAQKNIKEETVTLKIDPPKIDDGKLGTDYLFEIEANSIPQSVKQVEFTWDMGDGQLDSTGSGLADVEGKKAKMTLSHQFTAEETKEETYTYSIEVKVQDAETGDELAKTEAIVKIHKPVVVIEAPRIMTYEMAQGAKEVEHTFAAYVKNAAEDMYTFHWNFDDGTPVQETTGLESTVKHTYNQLGKYSPQVTLTNREGIPLSADSIYIELTEADTLTPKEATNEPTTKHDPWRKYDEGFAPLDYSKLYWSDSGTIVQYYNVDTNEYEGMELYFEDETKARLLSITYYLPFDKVIRMEYTTFDTYGKTEYHADGSISRIERYDYSGPDVIWYVKAYDESGKMYLEDNYKNEERHGPYYFEDWVGAEFSNWRLESKTYAVTEEYYFEGKLDGTCRYSFNNIPWGDPVKWESIRNYKKGVKHGEGLTYDVDGNLWWYELYDNGKELEFRHVGD